MFAAQCRFVCCKIVQNAAEPRCAAGWWCQVSEYSTTRPWAASWRISAERRSHTTVRCEHAPVNPPCQRASAITHPSQLLPVTLSEWFSSTLLRKVKYFFQVRRKYFSNPDKIFFYVGLKKWQYSPSSWKVLRWCKMKVTKIAANILTRQRKEVLINCTELAEFLAKGDLEQFTLESDSEMDSMLPSSMWPRTKLQNGTW